MTMDERTMLKRMGNLMKYVAMDQEDTTSWSVWGYGTEVTVTVQLHFLLEDLLPHTKKGWGAGYQMKVRKKIAY